MEEARVDFLAQSGWDYAKLEEMGIVSPVLSVSCDFKHPTTFSDRVTIHAAVKEFSGVKLRFQYEMKNQDGDVVCVGTSVHAFLNTEGKPIRMKREYPELFEAIIKVAEGSETNG
jgi:acyl-CoA thioester hydrolase